MVAIAVIAWFGLVLQFWLMIARTPEVLGAIINYFSFFTILSNLLVAVALTSALRMPHSRLGTFFSSNIVHSGVAVYILIVGVTYSLVLRSLWDPQGWQKLADILLHDLVPVVYVLYWLIFVAKVPHRWVNAFQWLLFPAVYLIYTLCRGAFASRYPYPFVDVAILGYGHVLRNTGILFCVFLGTGLLLVAISKLVALFDRSSQNLVPKAKMRARESPHSSRDA